SSFGALPVTWLDVSGKNIDRDNYIHWSTAAEINNDYFAVEVSANGADFTERGRVPGAGNSSGIQEYNFIDKNVSIRKAFYRVKQVDRDGRYSYSKVILLITGAGTGTGFAYVTNPAYNRVTAFIQSTQTFRTMVVITDAGGRVLQSQHVDLTTGGNQVSINVNNRAGGFYYLQYTDEHGKKQTAKFIKQ
ncbi:MAG TPA: T9SS type A sorting domain-containing protein, partial [Chitinophagaceae bacterium]|nr:T9SS type A sorting domain-containing protein [Chitinophagaceae bacterium]